MTKTPIKCQIGPLVLVMVGLLLPLLTHADTMTSQNYSIDSGRVGTDQISSSATSTNYSVDSTSGAVTSQNPNSSSSNSSGSSSDNDNDHSNGGHKKSSSSQNIAVAGNPGLTVTAPAANSNQPTSVSPTPSNANTNLGTTSPASSGWKKWAVPAAISVLILLIALVVIKQYREDK